MGTVQKPASSSDSDPNIEEKKRKRMLSNRESARRSRAKKQKQLEDLVNEASTLQEENNQFTEKIKVTTERFMEMESSNNVLRARVMELTDRVNSLNMLLQQLAGEGSGYTVDIPEITDTLMQPWQTPFPLIPIMASADVIDF
ncbi:basic region/leucine zipper motif 53 [Hibiscus trionum]|uniref:Basic region/leucine zipper motif 53 n=1 Tax=Hibiscus trionum TaxID=183268 RepID=A0A9W7LNA5_HIBTR|nr:basic region/leucine zipper motif 53 [Hibiscus trionum]